MSVSPSTSMYNFFKKGHSNKVKTYYFSVTSGSFFADNVIDIKQDIGCKANILVVTPSEEVWMRLNSDNDALLQIYKKETFEIDFIEISKAEFENRQLEDSDVRMIIGALIE